MSVSEICEADFHYYVPTAMEAKPFRQTVRTGREFENPGWEVCGFELKNHTSKIADWSSETDIQSTHYQEISDFARQLTGCDFALVGGHILRNPEQAELHEDLAPIQFVHSDFAESYGGLMREFYRSDAEEARLGLEREEATPQDVANASRMLILQFWRNVGPSVMDLPIAFCDARTVGEKEILAAPVEDYAGDGFDFETLAVLPPGDGHHAWYTYPDMSIDEVVAFRTYDSDLIGSGKPFWTPHSAYRNPDVALGEPARYSIELRATCLWK